MKRFFIFWIAIAFASAAACQSHQAADKAPEKLTRKVAAPAKSQNPRALAPAAQPLVPTSAKPSPAYIPENFSVYASEPASNGERCVVGSHTDRDGMNQRPVAYITNGESKKALWVDQLGLPPNTFQSRATHCAWSGSALFVLLQSDTQPEQSLSQTLLRVIKLDSTTGEVQAKRDIQVPGTSSAWVKEGSSHFQWKNSSLIISGHDLSSSPPRAQATFTMRMDNNLVPVEESKP